MTCVQVLGFTLESKVSGPPTSTDSASQTYFVRDLNEVNYFKRQRIEIHKGSHHIKATYTTDKFLLKYWGQAESVLSQLLKLDQSDPASLYYIAVSILRDMESRVVQLCDHLILVEKNGDLSPDLRSAIREKYRKIDFMLDMFHSELGTPRTSRTWLDLTLTSCLDIF